jgi:hypothetical protein
MACSCPFRFTEARMLRRTFALTLGFLTVLVLSNGCADKLDAFTITRSGSADVAGSVLPGVLTSALQLGGLGNMDFSQSAEFKNQGVKANQVDSVTLTKLHLQVTKPASGQDLQFLDKVEFFAEGKDTAGNPLPRVLVATGGPFTKGATGVDLTIPSQELKPYVIGPSMSITSDVKGKPPAQDTTLQVTVSMRVDVNVTGVITGK